MGLQLTRVVDGLLGGLVGELVDELVGELVGGLVGGLVAAGSEYGAAPSVGRARVGGRVQGCVVELRIVAVAARQHVDRRHFGQLVAGECSKKMCWADG